MRHKRLLRIWWRFGKSLCSPANFASLAGSCSSAQLLTADRFHRVKNKIYTTTTFCDNDRGHKSTQFPNRKQGSASVPKRAGRELYIYIISSDLRAVFRSAM